MNKLLKIVLGSFFALSLALTGFAQSKTAGKDLSIGLVTDTGGVHDQSFNESGYAGLTALKKDFGVKISYVESQKIADYTPNLQNMSNKGVSIILAMGYTFADPIMSVSTQKPNQKFLIVDYDYGKDAPKYPNTAGLIFKSQDGSFLAGYLASYMTKTNKIGFVGGISSPVIDTYDYGFLSGVQFGAKEQGKMISVIRQNIGSFTDAAKAKNTAVGMYTKGVDIIFTAAGAAGNGSIEAASEQNKWAIGVDQDQSYLAPKNVLTSVVKDVGASVYKITQDYLNTGKFPGGSTVVFGMKEKAIHLADDPKHFIPANINQKISALTDLISNGKIVPPATKDLYTAFASANNLK